MNEKIARELVRVAKSLLSSLGVGDTIETEKLRIQRWRSAIKVWDLTNAGRRGKRIEVISAYDLDMVDGGPVEDMAIEISRARTFQQAEKIIEKGVEYINSKQVGYGTAKIHRSQERGVDVAPGGFKPIKISGQYVYIESDHDSFVVRDLEDRYNEPTCIPSIKGKKTSVKMFYRWVMDNASRLKGMRFNEVTQEMGRAGIGYHYYCAVD